MAWDGLPEPILPMGPLYGPPDLLASYADFGVFVLIPWYYDVDNAGTLPSRKKMNVLKRGRDRALDNLSEELGNKKRRLKGRGSPVSDFFYANWIAFNEAYHGASMLRKATLKGTKVKVEDLLHGSPALQPGVRTQKDVTLHYRAFLYTCYSSAILERHPKALRVSMNLALGQVLSASDRTLKRVRHALRPTSTQRLQCGLIHP